MIDFRQLRGVMAASFDTDNLVSVTDKMTQTVRAENVPCHFVITKADSPGATQGAAEQVLPVTVYGEIYTSETPIIRENDAVVIEKKDTAGNVIATYEGTAGMPAYRAGRVVTVVEITAIKSEEEPTPAELKCYVKVPDGEGGYITSQNTYKYELSTLPDDAGGKYQILILSDPAFVFDGYFVTLNDPAFGTKRISKNTKFTDSLTASTYTAKADALHIDFSYSYVIIG